MDERKMKWVKKGVVKMMMSPDALCDFVYGRMICVDERLWRPGGKCILRRHGADGAGVDHFARYLRSERQPAGR